jgi:hypothetical protein
MRLLQFETQIKFECWCSCCKRVLMLQARATVHLSRARRRVWSRPIGLSTSDIALSSCRSRLLSTAGSTVKGKHVKSIGQTSKVTQNEPPQRSLLLPPICKFFCRRLLQKHHPTARVSMEASQLPATCPYAPPQAWEKPPVCRVRGCAP